MNWQCPVCAHDNTTARKCTECYYTKPQVNAHDLDDQVRLLLNTAGDRKVSAVARSESNLSEALFDVAAGSRQYWDRISWDALLERLDSSDLKVEAWLEERDVA
jgi:hypothetical protein